tara:strand:+ start:975 stop:1181 length:207 start_codon:yes stop_codon:yes gene_type:complete
MFTPDMVVHHRPEPKKQRCCIVGPRARFRMELNGETRLTDDIEALDGAVVGVHVANLDLGPVLIGDRR